MPLAPAPDVSEGLRRAGAALLRAREKGAARILMMGAHVLRKGCQRYLIDLMRRGHVSCLAVNGAGVIHDYELALAGPPPNPWPATSGKDSSACGGKPAG